VLRHKEPEPIAVLPEAVVFAHKALSPTATLSAPVLLSLIEQVPIAILLAPVVLLHNALYPKALLS
jgi:hypothetical protein